MKADRVTVPVLSTIRGAHLVFSIRHTTKILPPTRRVIMTGWPRPPVRRKVAEGGLKGTRVTLLGNHAQRLVRRCG
jgi:hypothetical protein